jgi:hypothetical protein
MALPMAGQHCTKTPKTRKLSRTSTTALMHESYFSKASALRGADKGVGGPQARLPGQLHHQLPHYSAPPSQPIPGTVYRHAAMPHRPSHSPHPPAHDTVAPPATMVVTSVRSSVLKGPRCHSTRHPHPTDTPPPTDTLCLAHLAAHMRPWPQDLSPKERTHATPPPHSQGCTPMLATDVAVLLSELAACERCHPTGLYIVECRKASNPLPCSTGLNWDLTTVHASAMLGQH